MPFEESKSPAHARQDEITFGEKCETVTPSDSADATDEAGRYFKYISVAATGNVVFVPYRNADGETVTLTGAAAGLIIPGRVRRVHATGTTATLHGWSD